MNHTLGDEAEAARFELLDAETHSAIRDAIEKGLPARSPAGPARPLRHFRFRAGDRAREMQKSLGAEEIAAARSPARRSPVGY